MSDCRFGVSPVNYPDPDPLPTPSGGKIDRCINYNTTSHILANGSKVDLFLTDVYIVNCV